MKKSKSVSEWDNPKNVPVLTKHPGVGHREYPSKQKLEGFGHENIPPAPGGKKFGRAKSRKHAAAALIQKAKKGK